MAAVKNDPSKENTPTVNKSIDHSALSIHPTWGHPAYQIYVDSKTIGVTYPSSSKLDAKKWFESSDFLHVRNDMHKSIMDDDKDLQLQLKELVAFDEELKTVKAKREALMAKIALITQLCETCRPGAAGVCYTPIWMHGRCNSCTKLYSFR